MAQSGQVGIGVDSLVYDFQFKDIYNASEYDFVLSDTLYSLDGLQSIGTSNLNSVLLVDSSSDIGDYSFVINNPTISNYGNDLMVITNNITYIGKEFVEDVFFTENNSCSGSDDIIDDCTYFKWIYDNKDEIKMQHSAGTSVNAVLTLMGNADKFDSSTTTWNATLTADDTTNTYTISEVLTLTNVLQYDGGSSNGTVIGPLYYEDSLIATNNFASQLMLQGSLATHKAIVIQVSF